ncbi:uncharacterized protein ACB058_011819 isoform 2-T3 [Synchiropus picturatus]
MVLPRTPPQAGEMQPHHSRRHVIWKVFRCESHIAVWSTVIQQVKHVAVPGQNSMFLLGYSGFLWASLLLSALLECVSASSVQVTVGSDATLPCTYDVRSNGKQHTCWGRGPVPSSGCASQIIMADGTSVTERTSGRYRLLGQVDQGDTSLTIQQVVESDSGVYGCRVMIPGWFNDIKKDVTLRVVPGPPRPLKVEVIEVREKTLTIRWSSSFNGGRPITSYRIECKDGQASWDTAVRTEVYSPEQTQLILVDLLPARSYSLRMFAANVVGTSGASNTLTFTTREAAPGGPPLDVQLQALSTQSMRVTWKPPRAELRNGNLLTYKISYRESHKIGRRWTDHVHPANSPQSLDLTGLKPSTEYSVMVQAGTKVGLGPASLPQTCSTFEELVTKLPPSETVWDSTTLSSVSELTESTTLWGTTVTTLSPDRPDPPVLVLKEVDEFTISLAWTPGFQGSSAIISYTLEYKPLDGKCPHCSPHLQSSVTSCSLFSPPATWNSTKIGIQFKPTETMTTILENTPSTYNIRMFSTNSHGTSEASNVLTVTTGHHESDVSTTVTTNNSASMGAEDEESVNIAAIVVPLVLVLLVVTAAIAWLFRFKQKHGHLNIRLMVRGPEHYKGSELESMQEL